ncbi:hypothetical protein [Microbulbifer sp. ALW1]|uniref:hypothetical protein n=1 Tax=Microbulbifer sp. (strain ALW1) TaxID=1516059 RepID=UPI001F3E6154|nr:hypothetical protein [Microbulbifer sp. ALW1]
MNNIRMFCGCVLLSIGFAGCSSAPPAASSYGLEQPFPAQQSTDWCQKNYFAASVGAQERQRNAIYCDEQYRRTSMMSAQKTRRDKPLSDR